MGGTERKRKPKPKPGPKPVPGVDPSTGLGVGRGFGLGIKLPGAIDRPEVRNRQRLRRVDTLIALSSVEAAIRGDISAEEKNRASHTVKNPNTPRRTLTNRHILQYYLDRKKGVYKGKPDREFHAVQRIMDEGSLSKAQWRGLYRRWTALHDLLFDPTPRQKEVGRIPGAIAEGSREGRAISIRGAVADILQFIHSTDEEEMDD